MKTASKDLVVENVERSVTTIDCTKNCFYMFKYFKIADVYRRACSHE
jgi:hypothetical protein